MSQEIRGQEHDLASHQHVIINETVTVPFLFASICSPLIPFIVHICLKISQNSNPFLFLNNKLLVHHK